MVSGSKREIKTTDIQLHTQNTEKPFLREHPLLASFGAATVLSLLAIGCSSSPYMRSTYIHPAAYSTHPPTSTTPRSTRAAQTYSSPSVAPPQTTATDWSFEFGRISGSIALSTQFREASFGERLRLIDSALNAFLEREGIIKDATERRQIVLICTVNATGLLMRAPVQVLNAVIRASTVGDMFNAATYLTDSDYSDGMFFLAAPATQPEASTGTNTSMQLPNPTDRVYLAYQQGEQPEIISGEDFRADHAPPFENIGITMNDLPLEGKLTLEDWEVEVMAANPDLSETDAERNTSINVVIRNPSLNYERSTSCSRNAKVFLLPFSETEYVTGPALIMVEPGASSIYFFNKVSNCVTIHVFDYDDVSGIPEIGTVAMWRDQKALYIAPPGSLTPDRDMLPGTRFYMYVLFTSQRDGDGPGGATRYLERGAN